MSSRLSFLIISESSTSTVLTKFLLFTDNRAINASERKEACPAALSQLSHAFFSSFDAELGD